MIINKVFNCCIILYFFFFEVICYAQDYEYLPEHCPFITHLETYYVLHEVPKKFNKNRKEGKDVWCILEWLIESGWMFCFDFVVLKKLNIDSYSQQVWLVKPLKFYGKCKLVKDEANLGIKSANITKGGVDLKIGKKYRTIAVECDCEENDKFWHIEKCSTMRIK